MSRNAETIRRLRAAAVAAGMCQVCRCREAKPGRKTCQACLDRGVATKKRLRGEGRCECGADPAPGIKQCRRCADADNRRAARLTASAIENGRCGHCRCRDAKPGLKHCQQCIDRGSMLSTAWRAANVAAGLCPCGNKRPRGFKTCADCRAYGRAYYAAHRSAA